MPEGLELWLSGDWGVEEDPYHNLISWTDRIHAHNFVPEGHDKVVRVGRGFLTFGRAWVASDAAITLGVCPSSPESNSCTAAHGLTTFLVVRTTKPISRAQGTYSDIFNYAHAACMNAVSQYFCEAPGESGGNQFFAFYPLDGQSIPVDEDFHVLTAGTHWPSGAMTAYGYSALDSVRRVIFYNITEDNACKGQGGWKWVEPQKFEVGGGGTMHSADGRPFPGDIAAVLVFKRMLEEGERKEVEELLMGQYSTASLH
jgi:hypothetical protein